MDVGNIKGNVGKYVVFNGKIEKVEDLSLQESFDNSAYEVVRIIEGVSLFWEDHFQRLKSSLKFLNLKENISSPEIKKQISDLLNANKVGTCNIKLVFFAKNGLLNYIIFVNQSYYPSDKEVLDGVCVSLDQLERTNPNAKILHSDYKGRVTQNIEQNAVFETLLVNGKNKITEGSRSNVFFVKGKKVFTAPKECILEGVTRKYVYVSCERLGIEIAETLIGVDELNEIEGFFLSGTSIKVLPISRIGDIEYKSGVHPTIVSIKNQYDKIIRQYISQNKVTYDMNNVVD